MEHNKPDANSSVGNKTGGHDSVGRLLFMLDFVKSIDSWKKLWITIILSLFFGVSIVIYPYRSDIVFWFLTRAQDPILNSKVVPDEVLGLDKDINADAIAIWSIERKDNLRVLQFMFVEGKRVPAIEGVSDLILVPYVDVTDILIELINEGVGCFNYSDMFRDILPAPSIKIKFFCAASIPPRLGFITGIIVVGYKSEPKNSSYIRHRLRMTAERLIRK
ncbi:hypothetical protein D3C77_320070 [compost metagenome]